MTISLLYREEYTLDISSEESEEEEELEFNPLMTAANTASSQNLNSGPNIYQKFKTKQKEKQITSKLAKKGRNRLIRSMQNLAYFRSRSRSNSADSMTSNEVPNKLKSSKKPSKTDLSGEKKDEVNPSGKSDLIKSLFVSFI